MCLEQLSVDAVSESTRRPRTANVHSLTMDEADCPSLQRSVSSSPAALVASSLAAPPTMTSRRRYRTAVQQQQQQQRAPRASCSARDSVHSAAHSRRRVKQSESLLLSLRNARTG